MKSRYRTYRRKGGLYYAHDHSTGKQHSLGTRDRAEAARLLAALNESSHSQSMNLQIARVYLTASNPRMVERTWGDVFGEVMALMGPQPLELAPPDTTVIELNPEIAEELAPQRPVGKKGKPLIHIPTETAASLFELLSDRAKSSLASSIRRGNPIKVALGVFSRMPMNKTKEKTEKVEKLFNALRGNDPGLVQRIEERARMLLLEEFSRMVEQYCAQLKKAAEDYHRHHPKPEAS